MDLFSRYVFRQAAGSLLLILLTLTAIVWVGTALKRLDLLTSQGQSLLVFVNMTLLALPNLMALIAPIALLIACLYTLDRLNADSELIVVTASGVRVWRLAIPFVALAMIVTVLLIAVNVYLMPKSLRELRSYITQVRTDLISQVLQPGQFSSPQEKLTFHIRDRAVNGDLVGLMIHDARDVEVMTYMAKNGEIVKRDDDAFLVMRNGHIHRYDPSETEKRVQIVAFDQYVFDISEFGPQSSVTEFKPQERYLHELLWPAADDPAFLRFPGKFRSELHNRFATLLYPLAWVLIAIACLGVARTVRQNRWTSIMIAFAVALMVRLTGLAATNLATLSASAVWLVYAVPITTIVGAALAIHVSMSPRLRAKLRVIVPSVSGLRDGVLGRVLRLPSYQHGEAAR